LPFVYHPFVYRHKSRWLIWWAFFYVHSFSCFALFFKCFFSYASSFHMIHDIHIFGLYGVGHLSCKCLAWALFKLPLQFAFLVSFCNHVIDIKILGVFFVPILFAILFTRGFGWCCLSCWFVLKFKECPSNIWDPSQLFQLKAFLFALFFLSSFRYLILVWHF